MTNSNLSDGCTAQSKALHWVWFIKSIIGALVILVIATSTALYTKTANALPIFARQVQQPCAACHVGGQYPELTAYGRYFKLTGYTQGDSNAKTKEGIGLPIAMSIQAGQNTMANNKDSTGAPIDSRNDQFSPDQISLYTGGRIADNIGLFAQLTSAFDRGSQSDGTIGMDNVDLRYADHISNKDKDIIWGISLNNNPTVTDVFNTVPAWSYPFQASASGSATDPPVKTALEGTFGGGTAVGTNAYVYLDRKYYAEVGAYWAASGPTSILTYIDAPNNNGTVSLVGANPYYRFAYTTEWGPNSLMLGVFGMNANIDDGSGNGVSTTFTDRGIDVQYQYISDPHVFSAQFRYIAENISDQTGTFAGPANLNSFYAKAMYVYRAKYGTGLAYWREEGSSDPYYAGGLGQDPPTNYLGISGSPNTTVWIPSIFWQPLQNVRLTLYQTIFSEYLGGTSNYDGKGRNASDNNTTYLYLWMAF
jgi:hypothetical protein